MSGLREYPAGSMEARLADLVFAMSCDPTVREAYDTEVEVAFAALVALARVYTDALADQPSLGTLADMAVDAADLADPSRVEDPSTARWLSLLAMSLDSVHDNLEYEANRR